ncbi:TPA: phage tail tip fiber protein, partial [Klebsiella pneumoniae]
GAIIDQRPVSVLPAGNQSPPDDIVITSRSVVNQGISVETMQVNWSAVSGAIAYEAQWRRNDGNWINVPRSSTTSFEVSGIYAGRYLVRVRAINAAEISSGWAYSEEKTLTGKVGEPLAPLALATRSLVHGVQVSWEFPTGSGDTLRTELQYSKNQDGSAPMPLSDVAYPGKSYQQMGLSMGAEFWYRARLVDRLGNESPWTGWVQGMASDNFDDYYENLTDAIKDTAAWEETQRTISETQEGIRNTQQELEQTAEALRKEAEDQAKQVSQDIDASAKSITADVDGKISAVNKTITDEITSVNEALDSGLAQANKGVQEAKSAVADANKQIATVNKSLTDSITQVRQSVTDTAAEINATIDLEIARVSKTLADGDAALNAQIKTAENGLKQSLSQVNTTLTNAVKQETADRIADVNAKASQAADELLAATQGIEASIESLTQVMKTADENLAREMSSLAAGANIQFDSQVIWHFNNQTTEGWTGSAGVPGVSQDGWLRPADSATDPYITSPGGLAVDGAAYRFIMLRFRKTGKPVWAGEIRWVSAGENFTNTKRYIVAEPEYADGVATLTVRDIPWTGNIDRIRLDLTNQQDASNFIEFDWIAVGRPAPGASTAALQDVRSTLSNALTAEAQARSTLAAQMRGSYDGNDLEKVTSGLLYQEKTARVTAISAEVKARESLQTQFNDNKAAVSGELSSLTTEQSAQASRIGGLETSLGKKADAAALTSLTQKVEQQGATLTSQGAALTSLTNRVGQTETGLAGTNEALSGLQSVVTQQGDRITSQGQSITKLTSDLGTTNSALAKKAEAAAVTALTQQVEQNGRDIRSNTDSITSLSNQLVNGQPNRWSRRIYPVQLANAGTVPSFSDVRAVAPTVVDEVADAAKLDFTSAGSYLIALYSCQVKVAADTTITLAPGARVFDDTGAIFVNGVQVAWGNASRNTVSFELKVGWNTVEFLVNQWTGQAYINLGLKLSDKVAEMYSGLGVSALANAAGVLSSNVSQIGNEVVSNSQSITQLRNALTQTDANVASKADQTAMNSLTGRVEKTESGLTAANANITSLKSAVRAGNASGGDLIPNPTFDPAYDQMGFSVVSTTAEEVPPGCPYGYAARIASRDHHPNFAAFPATLNDVIEISALVACGAGTANFNLYVGTAVRPDTSTGAPLMAGGGKSPSATWQRTTWRFKVTQAMVDRGYIRPFLQISQNSPYGTVWFVTDWHMRNVTAAQKVQDTADATAAAVDSLTTTVTQQGNLLTSTGNRTTQLENGLATTNAAVAKKADATAVQDLTNTVTQLGNDLTAANSAITKLTGNLANTDKALAQKADATALATLDTKVTQQGKTLESQSNSLTNLSNSLSQVAADIDASGQIPGNLVVNPSFERGLDGYTGRSTATSVVEVSAPHSGTRALKVDPGSVSPGQYIPFVQGRTYEIGVWVKEPGATTDNGAGNNKLRIGNSAGQPVFERPYNSGTVGTNWTLVSGRWKATETASLPVTLSNYLISGSRYFDDFYVTDVTDRVDIDATAGAVTGLTSRVSTAEGAITSQSQQLTNLQNSLNTTNNNVAQKASAQSVSDLTSRVTSAEGKITSQGQAITKLQGDLSSTTDKVNTKADQTALNALTGRVEKTEAGLTAANSNIVSLTAAVNAGNAAGDDYIPNPSFDPAYDRMGYDVVETTADGVPADCPFRYAVRLAGRDHVPKINNIAVTPGDVYEMSALVACGTGSADFNFYIGRATTATGGIGARASGGNTRTTTAWKRATWRFTVPADTNFLRPFLQVNQSSPFGTVWYAADWHMRNVTAANSAQKTADATAKAVDSLTTTVSQQGDTLSSIGTRTTSLENSLRSTNDTVSKKADTTAVTQLQGTVTQQGNDIAAANSALTKLSSDLATTNANVNKKADASAMNTLQNQVTEQGKTLSAQGDSLTQLSNSLSQTAADIDASGKMPGNLIVNGSFERGAAGFTGWSSTATVADLQVPHSGNKALKMSAGQSNLVGQEISITQGRTYRMGVWAKQDPGTTIKDADNTKFRVADSTGLLAGSNYGPFSSGWQLVTFDWKATKTTMASFQLTTFLSAGAMYFDDFHVLDVTDEKDIAANAGAISQMNTRVTAAEGAITTQAQQLTKLSGDLAVTNAAVSKKAEQSAVTGLTTRMTSAEGKLDSQSQQLTSLQNSLTTMNTELGKKADTSAVSSLTGRVSQVENTITSQSQSITSLTSTINTIRTQGANPWVDGTFESYSDGQVLGGSGTAVVVASQKFTGDKSLKLRRDENNGGNSDKQLGTWQSVREDAKFRFEFWAMMPADQAPSSGWTTLVGIQSQNAAGQNAWQAAVTISEASLGARDKWVKFTGIASNNGAGRTRAVVWISTRGATGNGTPGYSLYIDDLVITDVTDAKAAQDASDATASAVSGLTARVTDAEGKITAQAQQQTALASKVDNANSRVDNMAKTLSDSQSTQASLNTSLQSQIDAQAAANIKNQTTLDNAIKSVASITSTQHTHATALEALATQQTTLTSSVGDLSASVQNTAKTVADVNGTVSSLWSMKVETVNGKNVGAGITLGSNGETSDMILYADRFSLFNRNNATAVPVMIAEGNELYIDTARIKNSSLTSTKIADGSITNAKIGNEIRSNDFVDGSRGWRIAKDGSSQFNNVIVRGAVYATDGWFQGTVYANHIEGDIGSFAINIAQHRTRKVPKATWQWFELARFRRQNFDQVINIRGGLLQTDSITIYGGAKLRAGMSYAPGDDGGLNPGYLSYAMLLRGTGATSGGGSMELGIELMYETGGATRLLTAQESMNVDNMSFVVPAGTGDAVLRYGCYLDRNGQMVLTILSRFDAFAARNNNVIRGSST